MKRSKKKLSRHVKIKIKDDILSKNLEGEEIILNLSTGIYFALDRLGTEIWNLLKQGATVAEVVEMVTQNYDVDEQRCFRDIQRWVKQLEKKSLVEALS